MPIEKNPPKIHQLIVRSFFSNVFIASLMCYVLILFLEELKPGFISFYFNTNIILGILLFSGLVTIFFHNDNKKPGAVRKVRFFDYSMAFSLGVISFFLLLYKTRDLHYLGYIVSGTSGLIIVLIILISFYNDEESDTRV